LKALLWHREYGVRGYNNAAGVKQSIRLAENCRSCLFGINRQASVSSGMSGLWLPCCRVGNSLLPVLDAVAVSDTTLLSGHGHTFRFDMGDGFLSGEALSGPPPFDHARAVVEHKGLARNLVTRLKYGNRTELALWMAKWMLRAGDDLVEGADLVIPVPLHRWRFWLRGYNQSAELARVIARIRGKSFFPEGLVRKKYTRPQVGLDAKAREKNVRSVFMVPRKYKPRLKGRHIILVDDVYTTGATVKAATRVLKRAGATRVDILTFSRVVISHI